MEENTTTSESATLEQALAMGALGYKIIPVPKGQKFPKGLAEWQKRATDDEAQITDWWGSGEAGIGWAMGLQPNGKFLVAIDVDVADGKRGKQTIEEIISEYDLAHAFSETTTQRTGTGGYHFIFHSLDESLTNGKLGEHVDIRGEGGFIVVAPSIHPNGKPYTWAAGKAPWETPPAMLPNELLLILTAEHQVQAPERQVLPPQRQVSPSVSHETDSPADWARQNVSIADELHAAGWTYIETKGGDTYWCRPGKNPRDGHSAILHDDSPLVIWSTSAPMEFWRVGRDNPDGSRSLSPLEVYAACHHSGDVRAASRHIRKEMMPRPEPRPETPVSDPGSTAMQVEEEQSSELNLPDEFWASRPVLEHIRTAAWSMSCSPDAVLAGVMARYSANIPVPIQLPQMGTLDIFFVIAGHSGGYKSKAGKVAGQLYRGNYAERGVMMDRQVGSGEGLAEAFFDWQDEDGNPCGPTKKGARKVRTRWGLHFATDEGQALTASAGRMNSILIPTLCAAWMGESIGQLLADPTKSRMIDPMTVRISAEVRIQTAHGYKLFADEYASTGLAQRMICVYSLDPSIYARFQAGIPLPDWPGELVLPHPAVVGERMVLQLAPEIAGFFAESAAAGHNPNWAGDPLDTHANLSRLKVAAILALWESRTTVETADWDLAGMVMDSHRAVRRKLQSTKIQADYERRVTKVTLDAEAAVAVEDAKHKALLKDTVEFLSDIIARGETPKKRDLSAKKRTVYEEARRILEAQGLWPS